MNPLMEQMRTQLLSRPNVMQQGLVPRGPVSIEDAIRHLWMQPESSQAPPPAFDYPYRSPRGDYIWPEKDMGQN
jgi:hypothetical protein